MGRKFSSVKTPRNLRRFLCGGVATAAVAAGSIALAPSAHAQYGPYTCVQGLVWREAVSGDRVCVTPQWRAKTWEENRLGPSRVQPGGGPYGPDTCKQGYVWRETRPSDHVCVPPLSRTQNRQANANAVSGYAHPDQIPSNGFSAYWKNGDNQLVVTPPNSSFYSWEPAKGANYPRIGYGTVVFNERWLTQRDCQRSGSRTMYVLAVDETTGVVSNAGKVAVPLCLYP